jgi:histidinol phosphatase-like PHP family hydrolase
MQIINLDNRDYHCHSIVHSDGYNTFDELAQYAGKIGLTELAITDHSQICADYEKWSKPHRGIITRWKNVHNDVNIIFGVEGDLLNEEGDCCFDIQGKSARTGGINILSAHDHIFQSDKSTITDAYLKAIKRYHHKISFIGHLTHKKFAEVLDLEKVVRVANEHEIPLEFNCAQLMLGTGNIEKTKQMLSLADRIYVNSDAHTLHELGTYREEGFKYLRQERFL